MTTVVTQLSGELRLLSYLALLCLSLWSPYIIAAISVRGLRRVVGYPTGLYTDLPNWAQRCQRAHQNLIENLVPFGILVLIAHVTNVSNEITLLGTQMFFWARLGHAITTIAAVPWLRTAAFFAGWVGCVIIFWQIMVG